MTESSFSLSWAEFLALLQSFSCMTPKQVTSEREKVQLQQGIRQLIGFSEGENLGICADTGDMAFTCLIQYLKGLGYPLSPQLSDPPSTTEAVYLKYNTQRQSYYLEPYAGEYRGVLISIQAENDAITGTYGYFPLDLFEE